MRRAESSEPRPDRPPRRAGGGGAVGVVFAALAIIYGIALVMRVRLWARFTPLEAITALALGALLVMVSVWARGAADRHARYRARFGHKPLYYRRRDRWTPLPEEFRYEG